MYKLAGSSVHQVRLVQAILSTATVLLVYYLASLCLRPLSTLIATILVATYPPFIYANGLLLSEVVFTFFFALAIYMLLLGSLKYHITTLAASGFFMGLALLIRPTPFFLIPVLMCYSCLRLGNNRPLRLKCATLFTASLILTLAPWWIRNYYLYGKLVLFSTSGTNPLLWGVHPYFIGVSQTFDTIYSQHPTELERYHMWLHEAKHLAANYFQNRPVEYLKWLVFGKLSYLWSKPWVEDGSIALYLESIRKPLHLALVASGWLGTVLSVFSRAFVINFIAFIPVYYTIFHICFMGLPRYAFPVMPFMIILSVFFIEVTTGALVNRLRHLR
ncbi:MAG: ArnT family glycosyltransferase [Moorellaceae bacterium]